MIIVLLTNPRRDEVLLVRNDSPLGPLEYGLLGESWDERPQGTVGPNAFQRDLFSERGDTSPFGLYAEGNFWSFCDDVKKQLEHEPLVKADKVNKVNVHLSVAADWKDWRWWCTEALRGGLRESALWLPVAAVKRLGGPAAHTCYEQKARSAVTTAGIKAFLEQVKAVELTKAKMAGPKDAVRLDGRCIELEAADEAAYEKLVKRSKGLQDWWPKGYTVRVLPWAEEVTEERVVA